MHHKARDMLKKVQSAKTWSLPTFLERWYTDADCQKFLSDEGWTEEKIRQHDAHALEDHFYEATLGDMRRWKKNWHILCE